MASITTTLELTDNMTSPLKHISNALHMTTEYLNDMSDSLNKPFDSRGFDAIREEVNAANAEIDQMSDEIDEANNSQQRLNNSVKAGSSAFSSLLKSVGVYTLINTGVSMITNSLDSAIARFDKLNNFPKIMQQMGYSALEAENSVNRLSDGITGLPTSLDEIVSSTQRIALITGNLNTATETALALNNAFYASGSSAADASRGLTQYVQMLSKGKVDATSWLTLQETMGYALNETAAAFGYAGESAQNDLYSALQDGVITFNDFNNKLIELSNATGGFAEVALTATGGIGTAWQNLQTSITKGVTTIIGDFDQLLVTLGAGGIEGVIGSIRGAFESFFSAVSRVLNVVNGLIQTFPILKDVIGLIGSALGIVIGILGLYAAKLAIVKVATTVATAAQWLWNAAMNANPVFLIITALIVLVGIIYKVAKSMVDAGNAANTAFGVITGGINVVIQFFKNLGLSVANIFFGIVESVKALGNNIVTAFENSILNVKAFFYDLLSTVTKVIASIAEKLNSLPFIEFDYEGIGNKAQEYADKAAELRGSKGEYIDIAEAFDTGLNTFETWGNGWVDEAYNNGAAWGDGVSDKLSNFLNGDTTSSLEDSLSNGLDAGLSAFSNANNLLNDTTSSGAMGGGTEDDYLSSIDSNTSDIVSAVSNSSDEELKYLKEIAERLALANAAEPVIVNVDMSGMQNTVGSSSTDIDGFINTLTTAVSDAVVSSAEGVHA